MVNGVGVPIHVSGRLEDTGDSSNESTVSNTDRSQEGQTGTTVISPENPSPHFITVTGKYNTIP